MKNRNKDRQPVAIINALFRVFFQLIYTFLVEHLMPHHKTFEINRHKKSRLKSGIFYELNQLLVRP
jgi:hypothetical protein